MEQQIHRPTQNRVTISPEISTAAGLLAHDVPNFVRESVTLAKLEAKKTVRDVGVRAGILATGGYLALVGLFFVFTGLAFLISELTQRAWLGPLAVGGGLVVIAAIAVLIGLKTGGSKETSKAHPA